MWKVYVAAVAVALAGCASVAPSDATRVSPEWSAYRAQVLNERDHGKLGALAAQEKIEERYREIYGIDPTMEGAFAFGTKLYEEADVGDIPMDEADRLARARIDDALAHRESSAPLYVFPPEASD
jgi:hypothetical protein